MVEMAIGKYVIHPSSNKIEHVCHDAQHDTTVIAYKNKSNRLQCVKFIGKTVHYASVADCDVSLTEIETDKDKIPISQDSLKWLLSYPGFLLFREKTFSNTYRVTGVAFDFSLRLNSAWVGVADLKHWEFSTNFGVWFPVTEAGYTKWSSTWSHLGD